MFRKKSFRVEISISLRIDLANKEKSVIYTLRKTIQIYSFTYRFIKFGRLENNPSGIDVILFEDKPLC